MKSKFCLAVMLCLLFTPWPRPWSGTDVSAADDDLIEVEAEPEDSSIVVEGPRHPIACIDENTEGKTDYIALFSHVYGESVTVPKFAVAVQVDQSNTVLDVVNPSINGAPPVWEPNPVELAIPPGGYVLLAQDDSYATKGYKKFLATHFQAGDVIKLRKNGEVVPLDEIIGDGPKPGIRLDQQTMFTVNDQSVTLSGTITNMDPERGDTLTVNGRAVPVAEDGRFAAELELSEGTNYIDAVLHRDGKQVTNVSAVIYYKPEQAGEKQRVLLWVDQAANAHKFKTSSDIYRMLEKAADSGITGIILDVKGYEGFVSYQKNDLTGRPYVSEMSGPDRGGANPELDLLEEFIKHGHSLGLEIHAAVNVFAEGSMHENAVLDEHPDWEERVYRPEDGGAIVPIRESRAPNKIVAFVNPANEEVRQYQLDSVEEILKNYDVDGINLDRGRYDNDFADFSEESRMKFEAYLAERGKTLEAWPDDVYKWVYDNQGQAARVEGKHILDWWSYRAETIASFVEETRQLVDEYSAKKGKKIELSTYVGSWYETMYLHGINWASPDFRYDPRLRFAEDRIYTDDYYRTGYARNLDFIMIGTYQSTKAEIERYLTLGNVLTRGDIPLYASIALSNISEPEIQRDVFQAVKDQADGMMLFEYSMANFDMIKASLDNEVYVKPYQLGISVPGDAERFIEGDYVNVNRNEGQMNVYSPDYGRSTNTSKWGVEITVDATGTVIDTANKTQAMNWNWAVVEDNNSAIPEGGFVISALDPSGVREKRQLVASLYDLGDQVRAALLEGHLNVDGMTVTSRQQEIEGTVTVIGYGGQVEVFINGKRAKINGNRANPNGQHPDLSVPVRFSDKVKLERGVNEITITVYVDGMKTNEKTVTMTLE